VSQPSDCQSTDLSHEALLHVVGPDAEKFLQGQITCDVRRLDSATALPGAYCTPQGRVVCDFLLARTGPDAVALRLRAEIAERAAAVFGKYIIFSKAEVERHDDDWRLMGCWGDGSAALLQRVFGGKPEQQYGQVSGEAGLAIQLDREGRRFELWLRNDEIAARLRAETDPAPVEQWLEQDIAAGIARIEAATVEEFIPQMLNYDLTGHISFSKGCYTGQEVVARLHYRGTPKRRTFPATLTAKSNETPVAGTPAAGTPAAGTPAAGTPAAGTPAAGTPLHRGGGGQSSGNVVNACRTAAGTRLLVVATVADREDELHLGGPGGPALRLGEPPYPLSAE
jgi:folate-binding protein YgfZ